MKHSTEVKRLMEHEAVVDAYATDRDHIHDGEEGAIKQDDLVDPPPAEVALMKLSKALEKWQLSKAVKKWKAEAAVGKGEASGWVVGSTRGEQMGADEEPEFEGAKNEAGHQAAVGEPEAKNSATASQEEASVEHIKNRIPVEGQAVDEALPEPMAVNQEEEGDEAEDPEEEDPEEEEEKEKEDLLEEALSMATSEQAHSDKIGEELQREKARTLELSTELEQSKQTIAASKWEVEMMIRRISDLGHQAETAAAEAALLETTIDDLRHELKKSQDEVAQKATELSQKEGELEEQVESCNANTEQLRRSEATWKETADKANAKAEAALISERAAEARKLELEEKYEKDKENEMKNTINDLLTVAGDQFPLTKRVKELQKTNEQLQAKLDAEVEACKGKEKEMQDREQFSNKQHAAKDAKHTEELSTLQEKLSQKEGELEEQVESCNANTEQLRRSEATWKETADKANAKAEAALISERAAEARKLELEEKYEKEGKAWVTRCSSEKEGQLRMLLSIFQSGLPAPYMSLAKKLRPTHAQMASALPQDYLFNELQISLKEDLG